MDPKLYQKSEGRKRSSSKSHLQGSGRLQFLPTPLLTPSFTLFWHPTRLGLIVHRRGRINQTQQLFPKHWNWFFLYPSLSVSDTHHTDSAELRRVSNRLLNRYKHKNTCWSSVRKANFPSNGDEVNTIILEFPGKLVSQWKECPPSGLSKRNKHLVGI